MTAEIEKMYAELEKEADARAQTRYEQDVLSRQQETAQQETMQQKNTGITHRTQRSGELCSTENICYTHKQQNRYTCIGNIFGRIGIDKNYRT